MPGEEEEGPGRGRRDDGASANREGDGRGPVLDTSGTALPPPCPSLALLTQDQGGNGGRGHAAGTEQKGVRDAEVAIRDPAEDHSGDGRQEAHHRGLHLGRGAVTQGAGRFSAEVTEHSTSPPPAPSCSRRQAELACPVLPGGNDVFIYLVSHQTPVLGSAPCRSPGHVTG